MIAPPVISLVQDVDLGRPCAPKLSPFADVRAHFINRFERTTSTTR
jgi:hypothetical protein